MSDFPVYLFFHLPKTAGAALLDNAIQSFSISQTLRVNYSQRQFYHHPVTKKVCFYESEEDFRRLLRSLRFDQRENLRFIGGHDLPYGLHNQFCKKGEYFTFFRDPIRRTLSLYNYQCYQHDYLKKLKVKDEMHERLALYSKKFFLQNNKVPSFEEWLDQAYNQDYIFYWTQTRLMQHFGYLEPDLSDATIDRCLQKFFFVGLFESAHEDQLYLYQKIGVNRFWSPRNASLSSVSFTSLSPETVKKIELMNEEDIELYRAAQKHNLAYKKRITAFPKIIQQMERRKKWGLYHENIFLPAYKYLRVVLGPVRRAIKRTLSIHSYRPQLSKVIIWILSLFFFLNKKKRALPTAPKRILVSNVANFGDVIISTTILPILKKHYPECEIGFLCSKNSSPALKNHPLIDTLHTIDHWVMESSKGKLKATLKFLLDAYRVTKEIRSVRYEIAIDLYPYFFFTMLPIFWRAKIEARVSYYVKGFSPLITHILPNTSFEYMGRAHLNLLRAIGIETKAESHFPHYFSHFDPSLPKEAIIVHMGTANPLKEWDPLKWAEVVQSLLNQGETVVLTGKGEREQLHCDFVASKTGCMNLCNQLDWDQFSATVQQTKLLISVDSVAVHLASAVQNPCVVLFSGVSSIEIWKPPYEKCVVLMQRYSCTPCLAAEGCPLMSCIQDIEPAQVLAAAERFLKSKSTTTNLNLMNHLPSLNKPQSHQKLGEKPPLLSPHLHLPEENFEQHPHRPK